MIDLEILKKHGITEESLRERLTGDPLQWGNVQSPAGNPPTPPTLGQGESDREKVGRMLHRIRSRIQEGMNRNFKDFKLWYALDLAWDTPFRQISPTLLSTLMEKTASTEEVYEQAKNWGLSHLISEGKDPKSGKQGQTVNLPVFFNVFVPLVRAYVTIRWAKIMNDRDLTPLLKFDPVKLTTPLSLKCDVLTDRVEIISRQYGYLDVMKQAVLKMLVYGTALQFPMEEWHSEEQWKPADELDVTMGKKKPDGTPANAGEEIKTTTREGLRYHVPHPSRVYRDLSAGAYTFNYDSGAEYAGYWKIERYRKIRDGNYWNKDLIALGTMDLMANNRLFFTSVYSSCTMTVPTAPQKKTPEGPVLGASIGVGAGNMDREKEIANLYYGTDHGDQGVLITEHFEKLIPSENGLGDYDCPVWFRFVVAGDGCTVLYAAPLPYCPPIYYGYDADESRSENASLALEILPFQDQFSNFLTQILLTAKQNLANVTFIDEDQLTAETADKLRNLGEGYYRFLNVFGFSSRKAARGLNRIAEAVQRADLPKGNVNELIQVLREILNILERVLVMSSQEVAQAASHELRVDEVRNIAQSTSSRLQFSSKPVDHARDAMKRQIYQGLMAYGDAEFYVHIPSETPLDKPTLLAMGFTFMDEDKAEQAALKDRHVRVRISKDRVAVPMWEFASVRDGQDRSDNSKAGQVLAQILAAVVQSPFVMNLGADQCFDLTNKIIRWMGLPDVKLKNVNPQGDAQQQAAEQQQQLQQIVAVVMKQLEPELKPLLDHSNKQDEHNQTQDMEISLIMKGLQALGLNLQPLTQNGNGNSNNAPANGGGGSAQNPRLAAPAGVPVV